MALEGQRGKPPLHCSPSVSASWSCSLNLLCTLSADWQGESPCATVDLLAHSDAVSWAQGGLGFLTARLLVDLGTVVFRGRQHSLPGQGGKEGVITEM